MNDPLEVAMGREALLAAIEDIARKFESGELAAVSMRLFMADGTWQDISVGEDAEDRAVAMEKLRAAYANAQ